MSRDLTHNRRDAVRRWRCALAGTVCVVLIAGCGSGSIEDSSEGQVTVPPVEETPPSGATTPATTERRTVALTETYFGQPADEATKSIEVLGIFVASFKVCSGSVGEGEVRQITTGDGMILDDKDGLTEAAKAIEDGSVVQMKVGTGTPCD